MTSIQQTVNSTNVGTQQLMSVALSLQGNMDATEKTPDFIRKQSLAKLMFPSVWAEFNSLLTGLYKSLPPSRVVDLASGSGEAIFSLIRSVYNNINYEQILGIDPDSRSIEEAKSETLQSMLHNVNFLQGDIPEVFVGLEEASFDLVSAINALTHLPNPEAVISGSISLLAPGGILIVCDPEANLSETFFENIPELIELNRLFRLAIERNKYGIHINADLMETVGIIMEEKGLDKVQATDIEIPMGFKKDKDGIIDKSTAFMATLYMEKFRLTQRLVIKILKEDSDTHTISDKPFTAEGYEELFKICCQKITQLDDLRMYNIRMFTGQKPLNQTEA